MILGHVRAWARTFQEQLCGCFYGYVDQLGSDSAHQRGTERAVRVGGDSAVPLDLSGLRTLQAYRGGQFSMIDPILQAMLASKHGVLPASLLSPRPALRWVSCDLL